MFEDGTELCTAINHKFFVGGRIQFAKEIFAGDDIGKVVVRREVCEGQYFYDPLNVENGRVYNHDKLFTSHNTFFGTGDTLINAETLLSLRAKPPKSVRENGSFLVYEEPERGHEYITLVDVSKGRGQDYSTFNVIDISTTPFRQVAVYRNNTISPILFPNIIYKYATVYNNSYVVIESNDQGSVVCNGLYYDLEYENVHVTSAVKANSIGIEINRKTKRLGCSAIKDILENRKLDIVDENTILEISTFVAKGQSYEASDGNHDDLMMNLVMFGYFASTQFFSDMTDINLKQMLFEERMKNIEEDIPPFGFIDDGTSYIEEIENKEKHNIAWVDYDPREF